MVVPLIPIIGAALSAGASHVATSAAKNAETEEKLELVKKLANLTPEQSAAVDALKKQGVKEMRERVELGIGPFKPLPAKASAKATEAHERVLAKRVANLPPEEQKRVIDEFSRLTEAERREIEAAPDREKAIQAVTERKMKQAGVR